MKALPRNTRIDVTYINTGVSFDAAKLKNKFDILMFFENGNTGDYCVPEYVSGLNELDIPIIVKVGDIHALEKEKIMKIHDKYNINAYFGYQHTKSFYQNYPKNFKYKTILFGVEPSLYENLLPYDKRIKNKILNSGAVGSTKLSSRLVYKFTRGSANPLLHYKLRTKCNDLPYVEHTPTLQHGFVGNKYPLLLQKYATAIAATTTTYTTKYWEIPAAGCLTFMEITEKNNGDSLGFVDNKTAIFINEKNYVKKFEEYLSDTDNPKWKTIADAGKEYALTHLNNDVAVNSLVDLMEEVLKT